MRTIRFLSMSIIILLAVVLGSLLYCNMTINHAARNKLFSDTRLIPYNKVGLLLGTSPILPNGQPNPYYRYRIEAAIRLFNARKINYIIVSGDNGRKEYNEPEQMRTDLIAGGIDSNHIYLDYAGFRTFDSMVRLKEIFGQQSVTVISQKFHNQRAVYIASREGITAIGYNVTDLNIHAGFRTSCEKSLHGLKCSWIIF